MHLPAKDALLCIFSLRIPKNQVDAIRRAERKARKLNEEAREADDSIPEWKPVLLHAIAGAAVAVNSLKFYA